MSKRKKMEERFFKGLMFTATWLIIISLVFIIVTVFIKGLPALSWEMVSQAPQGGYYFGKGGGVLNAIVGSFYLATGSTLIAFSISLPIALYMNVYLGNSNRFLIFVRFLLDALWGIPSIVYGAFGFSIMLYLGVRSSLLAGMLTVAVMITPIMIRAMDEVLRVIPKGLIETSLSLGSTRTETAFKVLLRQGLPGFITAILLAFGRGIGDAASVLFTAGYTDNIPDSITQPVATLPLAIFFQLGSPIAEVRARAYAAAVILTLIILLISLSARSLSKGFKKYTV